LKALINPTDLFDNIFLKNRHQVYNTVLSLLQNQSDAEDVTQEVFVTVYENLKNFKEQSKISTWIYRIAVNKSLDFLKAKKTQKRLGFLISIFGNKNDNREIYDIPDFVHPGVISERREQAAILFKAIDKLPDNQKVAFNLSKIEGLSYAEIAEIQKISVSSVESLLFRARQNLQKFLREYL
jgi:RNA polymerase sigma factor (sigma-70 family)